MTIENSNDICSHRQLSPKKPKEQDKTTDRSRNAEGVTHESKKKSKQQTVLDFATRIELMSHSINRRKHTAQISTTKTTSANVSISNEYIYYVKNGFVCVLCIYGCYHEFKKKPSPKPKKEHIYETYVLYHPPLLLLILHFVRRNLKTFGKKQQFGV